jgi:uncharacterized protein YegP (UPF0339 family)
MFFPLSTWDDYNTIILESNDEKHRYKVRGPNGETLFCFEVYASHSEINRGVVNVYHDSNNKNAIVASEPGASCVDIYDALISHRSYLFEHDYDVKKIRKVQELIDDNFAKEWLKDHAK